MDWIRFLDENNIHYVTRGPNTKRGEVSIQCPYCGDDDPSEHLGINLETGKWGCHRNDYHRGTSTRRLIKAVLSCSYDQADFIAKQYSAADPDTLEAAISLLEGSPQSTTPEPPRSPDKEFAEFKAIKPRGVTKRFFKYLQKRGYDNPQDLGDKYDLKCALTGRYADRIILPVRMSGKLLGWTSRAITDPKNAPRYLASSNDVKATIFNYDQVKKGGRRLIITEGPFDALKLDNYLDYASHGEVRATCVFGTSVTIGQIAILRAIIKNYDNAWVLFDNNADGPAQELASWVDANTAYLPNGCKDPDGLSEREIAQLMNEDFNGAWFRFTPRFTTLYLKGHNPLKIT